MIVSWTNVNINMKWVIVVTYILGISMIGFDILNLYLGKISLPRIVIMDGAMIIALNLLTLKPYQDDEYF